MQRPTVQIEEIDNGYLVTVFGQPDSTGAVGPTINQYCADKNAVAAYLVSTMVPGATFTPAPPPPSP